MPTSKQRWDAADYAENSSAQLKWAQELIDKLALKGDEALLDIGCGDGKITAKIARALPQGRVHGIDFSLVSLYRPSARGATRRLSRGGGGPLSGRQSR